MKIRRLVTRLAVAAALAGWLAAGTAAADTLNVFVGYADTAGGLGASTFFPTPWIGSTFNGQTIVSQSGPLPAGFTYDSGAVRIDNPNAFPVAISDFQVSLNNTGGSPSVFAIWGAGIDLVLTPGQSGIFAQIGVTQGFDSSDFGVFGVAPPAILAPNTNGNGAIGGCATQNPANLTGFNGPGQACDPNNAPIISFFENGNLVSFRDTGFILDTGEYDFLTLSADSNESIDWNAIGTSPSRIGTTIPEPRSIALFGSGILGLIALLRRRDRIVRDR